MGCRIAMDQGKVPDGCPIDTFLRVLSREWTPHIVFALAADGETRFAELRRRLPGGISARVLTVRLRELAALELVARRDAGGFPRHVTYALTPAGRRLDGLLREVERLAQLLPAPVRAG